MITDKMRNFAMAVATTTTATIITGYIVDPHIGVLMSFFGAHILLALVLWGMINR